MDYKIFFGLVFLVTCQALSLSEIYKSLSDKDKPYFIRYFLAKGYKESVPTDSYLYPSIQFPSDLDMPEEYLQKFQNLDMEPQNFSVAFLKGFMEKYSLTPVEALLVARGSNQCPCGYCCEDYYLCLPNGNCINPGDAGSVCCA